MAAAVKHRTQARGTRHVMSDDLRKQIIQDRAGALVRRQGLNRFCIVSSITMLVATAMFFLDNAACFATVVFH